jgi:hypothetical protein
MRVPTGRLTSYTVTIGKVPSLNAFYASKHWTVRAKAKEKHCGEVLQQLQQLDKYELNHVSIKCRVHYRYDLDNSVMAIKFALDAFKNWGGVKDDSPKYVDRIKMTYDPSLPKEAVMAQQAQIQALQSRVMELEAKVKVLQRSIDTSLFI